ncbi:S-layer homology domain-containing protein [Nodosilinea sp. LEGE 06152]|uniref:S-layer homology domain-containing protein n=1 Tax=Nodosilinea sp. LEGE 06152 TaxID=2777966 RepID=UPI00188049C0|nr:S-layer homology domain-containing protein [Nodosilinea sp. LEGE 06152]MBE9160178.1 S-layer homology domain-containing protein [Nodosilinea sp. LEGE 06152]
MTQTNWAKLLRLAPLSAVLATLTLGSGAAIALAGELSSGPIQNFDWLKDEALLDQAVDAAHTKDDDDDDDDDDVESGEVIYQRRTTTTTTTVNQVSFSDISTNYWASGFVYRLSALNVVSGFPNGSFLPANNLTKAQYAAMIAQAFDRPATRQLVTLRNVSRSYWAYSAIQKAYTMGFLDVSNGVFDTNGTMTRLDMLVLLARGLNITEVTSGQSVDSLLSIFSDANQIPSQYRVVIAALVERGILVNYPTVTELNLFQVVSRSEACSFVYQALAYLGKVETIESAYIVNSSNFSSLSETITTTETTTTETTETSGGEVDDDDDDDDDDDGGRRQACNQGIGNGAEGCDPGNSRPHGGSNDEGGRTPGNR